uniref:Putative chitin binding peritrophin-a domain protein n=1 Tax=Rhodnius prolixus TaxID=13249 RepID=R4FJB4_RHOPR
MDSSNDKEEEALRNERDLRQALDTEQQLLQLANTSSNELCKDNCQTCNPNGNNKLRCHNESTIALCTSSGTEKLIRCSGLTPICHPKLNVCSSRYLINSDISSVDKQEPNFSCPSHNAYYPDVESCRKFYYCANGKPYQYKCEYNEVYNPLTRACALQSTTVPCRRFHCSGKNGRYTIYPGDPSVYALCSNNNAVEMFHCPFGQVMLETNQQCQTHCSREGLIKDYSSCSHYYECTRRLPGLFNSYKITRRSCPPNTVFDAVAAHCVPQEQYPQCATTTPSSTDEEIPVDVEEDSSTLSSSYITSTPDGITTTVTILPMETTLQY